MNTMKKRILVVDDEIIITRTLKKFLDGTGAYDVQVENHPTQALQAARQFKPDLIILDIQMPQLEGGELAALLQEDAMTKATPIVFLTALVQRDEVRASGGSIGGFRFIAKPLEPKMVIHTIETVLAT
jgi:two-component system, OmpR family, response regulator